MASAQSAQPSSRCQRSPVEAARRRGRSGGHDRSRPAQQKYDECLEHILEGIPRECHGGRRQRFEDLVQFCREMDAGIAPSVGVTYTVTFANKALTGTTNAFSLLEDQVRKANCGFAVYAQVGGSPVGYYFDVTASPEGYHQHGTATVISRAALLALVASGDILVLQGTPAGSERRIASLTGQPGTLTGAAPANIALLPMHPPTHWAQVPLLTKNWDPFVAPPNGFVFTHPLGLEPLSLKSVRLLQRALIQFAPGLGFTQMRHEAARRFCRCR